MPGVSERSAQPGKKSMYLMARTRPGEFSSKQTTPSGCATTSTNCSGNPKVRHAVRLDIVLIETEQCQTPMLPFSVPGYIDGIKFDEFENSESLKSKGDFLSSSDPA